MSEYSITQDQIDALLKEVSIEDRVHTQYAKIKNKIDRMLHKVTSEDLLTIKKNLALCMEELENNKPYSPNFINVFKTNYKDFSKGILQNTMDYALFEHVVKLENMIGAMLYKVEQERRRYPRFPLTVNLTLFLDNKTHDLVGGDISSVGISFYASIELSTGRRYTIGTPPPTSEELVADVLRVSRVEPQPLDIFRTGCAFPNLLPWERIREIISTSMANTS